MPKAPEIRDYNFSDGDLKQNADQCKINVTRDLASFTTRGVNNATLTAFQALIDVFNNLPTDDELVGPLTVATENKDAAAENIRKQIRSIRSIAQDKYGTKGKYRSFGFDDMDSMGDSDLYRLGGRVVRVGTTLQAELQPNGLTPAVLNNLNTIVVSFDGLINTQMSAVETRDISTQDRIVAGNTLYAEMVRLCNIGKSLFQDVDEAKYNDYVIINTPPPTPPAPPAP